MEVPYTNAEEAFLKMAQTPQYQDYVQAKNLHETYNTPETKTILEDALEQLLKTKESQRLLQPAYNGSEIFSDNVIAKHRAMQETPEYQQYQEAKEYHKIYNTPDTQAMVDFCKIELRNTKECQEWLRSTDQEKHVIHNITQSKKWMNEQEYTNFQAIKTVIQNRNNAWIAVQNTKEYQLFKQAKLAHALHNTPETESLLVQCQQHAKETQEYKQYYNIDQKLRTISGQPKINNTNSPIRIIQITQNKPQTNTTVCDCLHVPKGPYIPIPLESSNNKQLPY